MLRTMQQSHQLFPTSWVYLRHWSGFEMSLQMYAWLLFLKIWSFTYFWTHKKKPNNNFLNQLKQPACMWLHTESKALKCQAHYSYFRLPLRGFRVINYRRKICTPSSDRSWSAAHPRPTPPSPLLFTGSCLSLIGLQEHEGSCRYITDTLLVRSRTHIYTHNWYIETLETLEVEVFRDLPGKVLSPKVSIAGRLLVDWSLQVQVSAAQQDNSLQVHVLQPQQ